MTSACPRRRPPANTRRASVRLLAADRDLMAVTLVGVVVLRGVGRSGLSQNAIEFRCHLKRMQNSGVSTSGGGLESLASGHNVW